MEGRPTTPLEEQVRQDPRFSLIDKFYPQYTERLVPMYEAEMFNPANAHTTFWFGYFELVRDTIQKSVSILGDTEEAKEHIRDYQVGFWDVDWVWKLINRTKDLGFFETEIGKSYLLGMMKAHNNTVDTLTVNTSILQDLDLRVFPREE